MSFSICTQPKLPYQTYTPTEHIKNTEPNLVSNYGPMSISLTVDYTGCIERTRTQVTRELLIAERGGRIYLYPKQSAIGAHPFKVSERHTQVEQPGQDECCTWCHDSLATKAFFSGATAYHSTRTRRQQPPACPFRQAECSVTEPRATGIPFFFFFFFFPFVRFCVSRGNCL